MSHCDQPPRLRSFLFTHGRSEKTGDLPHASQQLHQATIPKGDGHNYVRLGNAPSTHIDQAQHEGGQGKGAQAQGGRVGEFTLGNVLVQARLELAAKGREAVGLAGVDVGERAVAEAGGSESGLVLLVGHLAVHAVGGGIGGVGIGGLMVHLLGAGEVIARVVGVVGLRGHSGGCEWVRCVWRAFSVMREWLTGSCTRTVLNEGDVVTVRQQALHRRCRGSEGLEVVEAT